MTDTCGCFASPPEPPKHHNRAGLAELAYRLGTHPEVLERLLRAVGANDALATLTTREPDDPSIALLDAFAVVADVLGFYQERIVNEGFLATATERRSILELARQIGYELAPGVAAHTYLAFSVEERGAVDDGNGIRCSIPAGTRVQSVPGQDELPQTFETSDDLLGYAELNDLRPRRTKLQSPATTADTVYLAGTATRLEAGDVVVIAPGDEDGVGVAGDPEARRVSRVVAEGGLDRTRVELAAEPAQAPLFLGAGAFAAGTGLLVFGGGTASAIDGVFAGGMVSGAGLDTFSALNHTSKGEITAYLGALLGWQPEPPPNAPGLYAMRRTAGVFGHNAPAEHTLEDNSVVGMDDGETIGTDGIELDSVVRAAAPGSYVVVETGDTRKVARVNTAVERSLAKWSVSAKITTITLSGPTASAAAPDVSAYKRRETTVFAQAERLPLAELPDTDPLRGPAIDLDAPRLFLEAGRTVIVSGEDSAAAGVQRTERRTVVAVHHGATSTRMTLDRALDYGYVPESVRIAANVVHATHGETVEEVLGSGDGSAHQQFALRRPPLTFVSAPTATGASSTLEIRVDGVRWDPADRLYGLEPTAERYELSRTDEGGTRVRFGEGEHGARVPTGAENVNARYRTGIGLAGLVGPRRLSLLQTRPLGVRDVVNPLAADGAAEPEDRDAARTAAPLTVRTLDRVVTVADYEDFARAFAGVGKARATLVSAGLRPMVHVSVATATGGVLDPQSDVYRNLQAALAAAGDPGVDVRLAGYRPAPFALAATLLLDQRYESGPVLDAVDDALSEHFSFARREFGQGVSVSEVTAVVLAVPGTIDVTVTRLDVIATADADPATLQDPLLADLARVQANGDIDPAQLLYLSTGGARLAERTA